MSEIVSADSNENSEVETSSPPLAPKNTKKITHEASPSNAAGRKRNATVESNSNRDDSAKTMKFVESIAYEELHCVICTEFLIEAHTLPCGHTFCKFCIERWMKTKKQKKNHCPICRKKITTLSPTFTIDNVIEITTSNHKNSNNNQETPRMKKTEPTASNPPDSGGTTNNQHHAEFRYFKLGVYGWRKKCLYILILALLVMVIINLALTLWVLKVMEFSSQGMGQLKIVAGGLRLEGRAFVLDALIASTIRSRAGQPIVIESSKNFTITTRDASGVLDNRIFLGNDRFECLTDNFKVINTKGTVLFSADHKEVVLGVDALRITGDGGTIFDGSVQTPLVRAESGHDLRLESPTRRLELRAPMGIGMASRAGDIKLMSLNDIKLKSVAGPIRLESGSVFMPMLPTATSSSRSSQIRTHDIFQVCVCENGKLFLAPPHAYCAVSEDHVCR